MKTLLPDNINGALNSIVTKCFEGNRIADRGMSILSIKFVMNKTEQILHPKLAHLFLQLADVVFSYQRSRNAFTDYGLTPEDVSNYDSPLQFFEIMLDYCIDLEGMIAEAIEIANEGDTTTYAFLIGFIGQVSNVTAQCLLLVDKYQQFDDNMLFDHMIEDFIIL